MTRNPLSILYPADHTVNFHNVPIFRCQAWALLDAWYHGQRFIVTSGDRRDNIIVWFNKTYGTHLHSQEYLYKGFEEGRPGFLPANPPYKGTHLLLGDGVVGRERQPLKPWQLGIDVVTDGRSNDCGPLVDWLNRSGYHVERPYPTGSEAHHMNFTSDPSFNARKRLTNYYRVKH